MASIQEFTPSGAIRLNLTIIYKTLRLACQGKFMTYRIL